jgi:hypothetical protein
MRLGGHVVPIIQRTVVFCRATKPNSVGYVFNVAFYVK